MAMALAAAPRIAVLGGGLAGCSFVFGLSQKLLPGSYSVDLFEMGRGPGGRSATRKSRDVPWLELHHGTPVFEAETADFQALCHDMSVPAWTADDRVARVLADGTVASDATAGTPRFVGGDHLAASLLRAAGPEACTTHFKTAIRRIEMLDAPAQADATPTQDGTTWRLFGKDEQLLGEFDWLVLASATVAHPRWTKAFGGEPPFLAAVRAAGAPQPRLSQALASVAAVDSNPVTITMLGFEPGSDGAAAWAAVPPLLRFDDSTVLAKCVVTKMPEGGVGVVLHSTHEYSANPSTASVYGATSTAARVVGAHSEPNREQQITADMLAELVRLLGNVPSVEQAVSTLPTADSPGSAGGGCTWGPHLHRWGSAFPQGHVPQAQAFHGEARAAFCGDFVESAAGGAARVGSAEGAVLSGLEAAAELAARVGAGAEQCP